MLDFKQLFALNSDNENVSILSIIIHCLCPEWITCSMLTIFTYTIYTLYCCFR